MTDICFIELCKETVRDYVNSHTDKTDAMQIDSDDAYVVWLCKALQNWKALVSTTPTDGMYYELTYNGDKNELYVDCYKKWENYVVRKHTEQKRVNEIINGMFDDHDYSGLLEEM